MNSSAQTELSGVTVFEPITLKEPESTGVAGDAGELIVGPPLHPAKTSAVTKMKAIAKIERFIPEVCNIILLTTYSCQDNIGGSALPFRYQAKRRVMSLPSIDNSNRETLTAL